MKTIRIGLKTIGEEHPCLIIAEAGLNHNGNVDIALKLIEAAAECGVDAIKFQTYTTKELFAPDHPEYDKFQTMVFDHPTYERLRFHAEKQSILFLSTPFDEASADLLDDIGVPAFKIGSGELTHLSFLQYLSKKGKPLILSTGMSTLDEIDNAVTTIRDSGNDQLILLHCISVYPCPPGEANVRILCTLQERFWLPIGYSDHTQTDAAAAAAVALGARVVEKHFTLSHHLPGWDHFFSYDPPQMKQFVQTIRETEQALGSPEKEIRELEKPIHAIARRALYARVNLASGAILSHDVILVRRPAGPLPADRLDHVLGKKILRNVAAGEALQPGDVEET
ncbi:MAG: N-acetylneuraminate synthase [Candidatus Omnitrophota bacterium]|jgi:N-acetylneuraminate synthase/N,N'-diacetyllegionaminate synthase|nr:MAG: N-acetylneuraminate synthase [Candidatus Omnitrophota bacterium]